MIVPSSSVSPPASRCAVGAEFSLKPLVGPEDNRPLGRRTALPNSGSCAARAYPWGRSRNGSA